MINILCINYNTPDLIGKLIESYYRFGYDKYRLIIIDGSDKKEYVAQSRKIQEKHKNVLFDFVGYNIHHGTGLHYAIHKYVSDYHLLVDSDLQFIKEGFVEYCLSNMKPYGIGRWEKMREGDDILDYMHPNGCLISHKMYIKHKPLIAHGAPFRNTMADLHTKGIFYDVIGQLSADRTVTDNYYSFVEKGKRGTRERFGMSKDLFVKLNKKFGVA